MRVGGVAARVTSALLSGRIMPPPSDRRGEAHWSPATDPQWVITTCEALQRQADNIPSLTAAAGASCWAEAAAYYGSEWEANADVAARRATSSSAGA